MKRIELDPTPSEAERIIADSIYPDQWAQEGFTLEKEKLRPKILVIPPNIILGQE